MYVRKATGRRTATLPDGSILTQADLPAADTRWVARRKLTVVQAIRYGLIKREDAIDRYQLTVEELDAWTAAVQGPGPDALKVTTIQKYSHTTAD